jgi:hypothetical protein
MKSSLLFWLLATSSVLSNHSQAQDASLIKVLEVRDYILQPG